MATACRLILCVGTSIVGQWNGVSEQVFACDIVACITKSSQFHSNGCHPRKFTPEQASGCIIYPDGSRYDGGMKAAGGLANVVPHGRGVRSCAALNHRLINRGCYTLMSVILQISRRHGVRRRMGVGHSVRQGHGYPRQRVNFQWQLRKRRCVRRSIVLVPWRSHRGEGQVVAGSAAWRGAFFVVCLFLCFFVGYSCIFHT